MILREPSLHRLTTLSAETKVSKPGSLERTGLLEEEASAEAVVVAYHGRTKHHVHHRLSRPG